MASSTASPLVEKEEKFTRASTRLNNLTPPFTRRLRRAGNLIAANGEPVIDVHEVLQQNPSKEISTTGHNIEGEWGEIAALDVLDEEADSIFAEPAQNGHLSEDARRLSRRSSDVGGQKEGSAVGSVKRRMGLVDPSSKVYSGDMQNNSSGESLCSPLQDISIQSEAPRQEMSPSPPKNDLRRAIMSQESSRDHFFRNGPTVTSNFEHAASAKQADDENIEDDYGDESILVDNPVILQEFDEQASERMSVASTSYYSFRTTSALSSTGSTGKDASTLNNVEIDDYEEPVELLEVTVPKRWLEGTEICIVSEKGRKMRRFRLDPDQGYILWDSRTNGFIRIENIKEIRVGALARHNMDQLNHPKSDESRWMTITYFADQKYKVLHLVARNRIEFQSFHDTLRRIRALRFAMLSLPFDPHRPYFQNGTTISLPYDSYGPYSQGGPTISNASLETVTTYGAHAFGPTLSKLLPAHTQLVYKHLTNEQRQRLWERHYWKGTNFSGDGGVDFREIKQMAHRLSFGLGSQELSLLFNGARRSGGAYMDFEEFGVFWRRLSARMDIKLLWRRLLVDERLEFPVFEQFMRTEQKDTRSKEELENVFFYYATSTATDTSLQSTYNRETKPFISFLTLEAFTAYLMSSDNAPFTDQFLGVHQDMSRPLSEYYISSSRNQLVGNNSIEGYIRALLSGCRCVEIEVHDGDREPVITQGGILTSKIPLRIICEVIEKNAFVNSIYPVIISAEVHCGVAQQDCIALIMKECFGDKLVDQRLDGGDASEPLKQLPSPQMLMNKILLTTKNPNVVNINAGEAVPVIAAETDDATSNDTSSDQEVIFRERRGSFSVSRGRKESQSHNLNPKKPVGILEVEQDTMNDPADGTLTQASKSSTSLKAQIFSQALARLLVYTVGVKYRGMNKKEHYSVEHMFSLSEKETDKLLKEGGVRYAKPEDSQQTNSENSFSGGILDLIKHSQTHLVKTYPKGTRLKPINYLPHRYWAAGAQLVAINWQTSDLGSMINHAMFLRNGKSGYVLKPAILRPSEHKIKETFYSRKTYELDLTVISAQQIPRPRDKDDRDIIDKSTMDPYVQVYLYVPDWPGASSMRRSVDQSGPSNSSRYVLQSASTPARVVRVQTNAVKNNGFNPAWQNSFRLRFEVVGDMLDLVFIRFCVRDEGGGEGDRPLALYCTSVGSLKQGYRHLPLHDQQMSQYLFATLFIHTNLREVVI